jgi:hypothetical protein
MSRLKVAFDTPEHGWLKLELHSDEVVFCDTFSHIYSTLPNLCDALCEVAMGRRSRPVVFLLEPHELELRFTPQDEQRCILNAVRFPNQRRDLENGEVVFRHSGLPEEIVLSFWRALRQLQTCLPEGDFTTRWRNPFPATEMASLTAAVAAIKAARQERVNPRAAG